MKLLRNIERTEQMRASQMGFNWLEEMAGSRVGVLSLCVFKPEVIHEDGKAFGGQRKEVAYRTWLEWYTPLGHSEEAQTFAA
jgi:hypothetical protein